MKKLLILFLAPMLMATQCEDDELLVTTQYFIQNDTSIDLIYITEADNEFVIESGARFNFNGGPNDSAAVSPAENEFITNITLFKTDDNGDLIVTYEQDPIVDTLWVFNEIAMNDFEYTLVLTDNLID